MKKYLSIVILLAIVGCNPRHPIYDCSKRAARQSEKHAYKSLAKCPDAFVDIYGKRFPMQADTVYSSVTVPGVEVVRVDTAWVTDTVTIEGRTVVKQSPVITRYITRHDVTTNWVTKTDPSQMRIWQDKYAASAAREKEKDELIGKLWVGVGILCILLVVAIIGWLRR